jgi:hypothetical protein
MAITTTPGSCAGRLTGVCPVTGGAPGSGPGPFRGGGAGRPLGRGNGIGGRLLMEGLEQVIKNKVDQAMKVK